MLIDKNKNKNKVMTQAITEAVATALRVEPGGNITVRSTAKLWAWEQ